MCDERANSDDAIPLPRDGECCESEASAVVTLRELGEEEPKEAPIRLDVVGELRACWTGASVHAVTLGASDRQARVTALHPPTSR